jgi:site-specific DNA recombinase
MDLDPWQRPDLTPWLTDRTHEWDAIVFTKIDRAFRSIRDAVSSQNGSRTAARSSSSRTMGSNSTTAIPISACKIRCSEIFLYLGSFFRRGNVEIP